jgi:hypothetical protein
MDSVRRVDTHISLKVPERNDKLHVALDVGILIGSVLIVLNAIADGIIFYGIHCAVLSLNNLLLPSMLALSVPGLGMALCVFVIIVVLIDMCGIIYLNIKK